jgi:tungstate transport system ATP-binding protein
MIEIKNLTLPGILNDVSATLAAPVTVILGANGAGKSQLLRSVHGLAQPSSGQINAPSEQAMVFQETLVLNRSVADNLKFARPGACDSQIQSSLEQVQLSHLADRPAPLLSLGEKQRLAMARALITQPRLLLLDEPSASLDLQSSQVLESIIAELSDVQIILVTHSLAQAKRLANEVVFMHRGRLLEQTSAEQFFDRPTTQEAQSYVALERW